MQSLQEILNNFKGRIKNPLIASFILVWLYRHWRLVYSLISFDETYDLSGRTNFIRSYIKNHDGFSGMIAVPLGFAFLSLIVYYLIAIAAQSIKILIGKRLNAQMLGKLDTGTFVFKYELQAEKNEHQNTQAELIEAKNSVIRSRAEADNAKNQKEIVESKLIQITNNLVRAESNILKNDEFISKFEQLMVYHLAEVTGIKNTLRRPEKKKNMFSVLDGTYEIYTNQSYLKNQGNRYLLSFSGDAVEDVQDKKYGVVRDFIYDRMYNIMNFTIEKLSGESESYNLIRLTNDEFIGFCDEKFCQFKRDL